MKPSSRNVVARSRAPGKSTSRHFALPVPGSGSATNAIGVGVGGRRKQEAKTMHERQSRRMRWVVPLACAGRFMVRPSEALCGSRAAKRLHLLNVEAALHDSAVDEADLEVARRPRADLDEQDGR